MLNFQRLLWFFQTEILKRLLKKKGLSSNLNLILRNSLGAVRSIFVSETPSECLSIVAIALLILQNKITVMKLQGVSNLKKAKSL